MTHGDFGELIRQLLLYGAGAALFAFGGQRFTAWRYFATLALMTGNLIFGRVVLAIDVQTAWAACVAYQAIAALIMFVAAETWVGLVIGALFGVSIIGGGLTAMGILSPFPSIGLTGNFWSVMSVASYAMDATMMAYAATRAGRKWVNG